MATKNLEGFQDRIISENFEKVSDDPTGFFYKCRIDTKKCFRPHNGKKRSNLVNHVKTVHHEFFNGNYSSNAESIARLRLEYIQHCTELVTVNSEPLALLTKSGFLKLNFYKLEKLKRAGYDSGLTVPGCPAVKKQIDYLAAEIIDRIKSEVNKKFVSIMVDGATRYKRSILGIYLQYMFDSRIVVRSIGMVNLTTKHTGENLANVIRERLATVGVKTSQVIAVTTDNGTNMKSMIDRLNDDEEEIDDTVENNWIFRIHI